MENFKFQIINLCLFYMVLAYSDDHNEIYRINGKHYGFYKYKNSLLSINCRDRVIECSAKKTLNSNLRIKLKKGALNGGKNPGAVACKQLQDAHIVLAQSLDGNYQSFCVFKDMSMISANSLIKKISK